MGKRAIEGKIRTVKGIVTCGRRWLLIVVDVTRYIGEEPFQMAELRLFNCMTRSKVKTGNRERFARTWSITKSTAEEFKRVYWDANEQCVRWGEGNDFVSKDALEKGSVYLCDVSGGVY